MESANFRSQISPVHRYRRETTLSTINSWFQLFWLEEEIYQKKRKKAPAKDKTNMAGKQQRQNAAQVKKEVCYSPMSENNYDETDGFVVIDDELRARWVGSLPPLHKKFQ